MVPYVRSGHIWMNPPAAAAVPSIAVPTWNCGKTQTACDLATEEADLRRQAGLWFPGMAIAEAGNYYSGYDMAVCQNLVPLVNIKIAGKWMFIPLNMVLIGIDP